jgi:hypothetical protein
MVMGGSSEVQILIKAKDEASKSLDAINNRIGGMSKQCRAAGIAMVAAGTAITATVGMSVKAFAKAGDEVQKMALRTGFATETLSELRYALSICGSDLSAMDTATRRMSQAIVQANEGMATYARAFDRIGLSVSDLMGLKPEDQFWTIAYALAGVEDQAIKAATAQDIFGRSGTQLLPLLAEGADGIQKLRDEAHKLGIVFSQEAADKAAELNDAFTRLGDSISGLKYQLGEALAPALTNIADKITAVVTGIREWGEAHPALYQQLVTTGSAIGLMMIPVGTFLIMLPSLAAGVKTLAGWFGKLGAAATTTAGQIGMLTAGIGMMTVGFIELEKHQAHVAELQDAQAKGQRDVNDLLNQYNALRGQYSEEQKKYAAGEVNNLVGVNNALASLAQQIVDYGDNMEATYGIQMKNIEEWRQTAARLKEQGTALEDYNTKLAEYDEAVKGATALTVDFGNGIVDLTNLSSAAAAEIVGYFSKAYSSAKEMWEAMFKMTGGKGIPGAVMEARWGAAWSETPGTLAAATQRAASMYIYATQQGGVLPAQAWTTIYGHGALSYQKGGEVKETGLAWVHKGEYMLPAGSRGRQAPIVNVNVEVYLDKQKLVREVIEGITQQVRIQGGG